MSTLRHTGLLGCLLAAVLACGTDIATEPEPDPGQDPTPTLRHEAELTSGCFGWPAQPFSLTNRVETATSVAAGTAAIHFTLRDTAGTVHTLAGLLQTQPVLVVFGSFT